MSSHDHNWNVYDPTWLVTLAKEQHPDKPWLAHALSQCTRYRRESRAYFHFIDADRANQPGSIWQFVQNLQLYDRTEGDLILDILTDQRVGGLEFLNKL
jgi:hypothetical protein